MNPEFQEPAITYLPSLNSIKRNIVSENRTSFVVSNRGLNLSFIAIHHLSSLFITRLQIPSASRFLFQALPILRIRHRDKDTRRVCVCVHAVICVENTRLSVTKEGVPTEGDASYVPKKKKTSKKQEISGAESHPTRRDFRHGLSVNLTSFTSNIDIETKSLFCTNENIILPWDRYILFNEEWKQSGDDDSILI